MIDGFSVLMAIGVALGPGVNPGNRTVLLVELFIDLNAKNEVKIPAARAVIRIRV